MKIHPEIRNACTEILERAYSSGLPSEAELLNLKQAIQWFENPDQDFCFSFTLSFSRYGESINFDIEHEGMSLKIEEYSTSNEGAGSDHFKSYEYSNSWEGNVSEEGEIYIWEANAKDALSHIDDEGEVEVSISVEED